MYTLVWWRCIFFWVRLSRWWGQCTSISGPRVLSCFNGSGVYAGLQNNSEVASSWALCIDQMLSKLQSRFFLNTMDNCVAGQNIRKNRLMERFLSTASSLEKHQILPFLPLRLASISKRRASSMVRHNLDLSQPSHPADAEFVSGNRNFFRTKQNLCTAWVIYVLSAWFKIEYV